jgi:hypothetical protein
MHRGPTIEWFIQRAIAGLPAFKTSAVSALHLLPITSSKCTMVSGDIKNHGRRTANRFGLGRRLKQVDASLLVNENTTAWEIYNNRATKTDTELIKDCNDSLNTLLIFVCGVFFLSVCSQI